MLTAAMKTLIENYSAGCVATINADGTPAVSPKATFVVVDDQTIAYGNLRSPGTERNIGANPAVEVVFTDVLARRAVRVSGSAVVVEKDSDGGAALKPYFEAIWSPYIERMRNFVRIDLASAQFIMSPAYDIGLSERELIDVNLKKLNDVASRQ